MFFILSFLFISIIIEIFILGIIYSSFVINIENLEVNSINTQINIDEMIVSIEIKLYKILKIAKINLYKDYFKIWGIKIPYKKEWKYNSKTEWFIKIYQFIIKRKANIELECFKLYLNFGTEDAIITSMLTATFSGLIVLILNKFVSEFNNQDYNFKITPNYFNTNNFSMKFKSKINLKTREVIGKI